MADSITSGHGRGISGSVKSVVKIRLEEYFNRLLSGAFGEQVLFIEDDGIGCLEAGVFEAL